MVYLKIRNYREASLLKIHSFKKKQYGSAVESRQNLKHRKPQIKLLFFLGVGVQKYFVMLST